MSMSAYVTEASSDASVDFAELLPHTAHLKDGTQVRLELMTSPYHEAATAIFNDIVEEGTTYPQMHQHTVDQWRAYFCSEHCFALCVVDDDDRTHELIGAFYIHPNYCGRSGHISNGGFIVHTSWRGKGAGRIMANHFLQLAARAGYQAVMFNLVYVTNVASIALWRSLEFSEIGRIPGAGVLKGIEEPVDAIQFYKRLI